MYKTAQLIEDGMRQALEDNAYIFKQAGECCACGKCDATCPCEKCKSECEHCMDEAECMAEINLTLSKVAEILEKYDLEKSADLITKAMQYFVSELAIKKFADESADVSDKLYKTLLDISQSHPDLKHDIKNLLLEVGEEGISPEDLEYTELAPVSEDEAIELPAPSKLPEFNTDFQPGQGNDNPTMPPTSKEYDLEDTELPPGLASALHELAKLAEEKDADWEDDEDDEDVE